MKNDLIQLEGDLLELYRCINKVRDTLMDILPVTQDEKPSSESIIRKSCSIVDVASTSTCGDVQLWFDWVNEGEGGFQ